MVVAIKRSTRRAPRGEQWRSRAPTRAKPRAQQRMLAVQHALHGEPSRIKPAVTLPKLKFMESDA